MNRIVKQALVLCAALASLSSGAPALAQATFPSGPNPTAVTTFHSIGLYWYVPGAGDTVTVRFRKAGTVAWRDGLQLPNGEGLWYDSRNGEYRGSLVELKPGTLYDIELTRGGSTTTLQASTWSEEFPVLGGHTVTVPAGTTRIVIQPTSAGTPSTSTSGSTLTVNAPSGLTSFTRVTANPGQNVIIGSTASSECIQVNHGTRNVLISGLVLQDCTRFGIRFLGGNAEPRTENIVIESNEIVGWGSFDSTAGIPRNDGAIYCNFSATVKPERIVVQRNKMHSPRHGGTPWGPNDVHPQGAQAVTFGANCGHNHVIRYNDIYSTNGNHYNDALGGSSNFSTQGFPWADADIYGNRISHVYDDAIEAEGGNRNVRIWANYIDRTFVAIANAATVTGPLYVWRNVSNDMANMKDPTAPNEGIASRGPFVKAASNSSDPAMNGGRAYYFHNTLLQPPSQQAGQPYPRGAGFGLAGSGGSLPLYNFVSLNNVWHINRVPPVSGEVDYKSISADCNVQGPCIADYDFFNGMMVNASNPDAPEIHGTGNPTSGNEASVPTYATSGGSYPAVGALPSEVNGWSGNFVLTPSSVGQGAGLHLPNFNDLQNPDPGAHQSGTPPMVFGRSACQPYYSSCKSR